MLKIRKSLFETNSSSTHSMTMCSSEEYESWKQGKLIYYDGSLITLEQMEEDRKNNKYFYEDEYKTHESYFKDNNYEVFEDSYITKNGEKIVAFGYFGYDG